MLSHVTQAILATLILGSGVAILLKLRIAKGQPHAAIDNIIIRVNAWWVMAGAGGRGVPGRAVGGLSAVRPGFPCWHCGSS
jgi:hypothetical protein